MRILLIALLGFVALKATCQDLLSQLQQSTPPEKEYVIQTFKGSRLVNGHSVETKGKGELEFIIGHRFGRLNSGGYELFGLDQAYIRFGLEYGITPRLGIGVGRSSYNKIYDGYLKYKALAQSRNGGSPVTVTVMASTGIQTGDKTLSTADQVYYSSQVHIARKFSQKFSLQISPSFLAINNAVPTDENKSQLALGMGGRYKLTKSLAINAEYYHRFDVPSTSQYYDAVSLGFDIETGGHVFQLIFSNTQGMVDRTFIGQTNGDFFGGDIHFGFNITRTFQLKKSK